MTDSERLRRLLICGAEALSAHASAEQRERRRARQMGLLTAGGLSSDELVLVLKDVLDEPGEDA